MADTTALRMSLRYCMRSSSVKESMLTMRNMRVMVLFPVSAVPGPSQHTDHAAAAGRPYRETGPSLGPPAPGALAGRRRSQPCVASEPLSPRPTQAQCKATRSPYRPKRTATRHRPTPTFSKAANAAAGPHDCRTEIGSRSRLACGDQIGDRADGPACCARARHAGPRRLSQLLLSVLQTKTRLNKYIIVRALGIVSSTFILLPSGPHTLVQANSTTNNSRALEPVRPRRSRAFEIAVASPLVAPAAGAAAVGRRHASANLFPRTVAPTLPPARRQSAAAGSGFPTVVPTSAFRRIR